MSHILRLLWIALVALLWLPMASQGSQPTQNGQLSLPAIALANLHIEARDTLHAIKQGGSFVYPRDGVVFKNYERILPKHPHGYYREYTVKTPGARNRGARRIISGELNEYYYTADHYKTFKRILE